MNITRGKSDGIRTSRRFGIPALAGLALLLSAPGSAPQSGDTAAADALRRQARAVLAQTSGQMEVPGLRAPVEVLRDAWGVAHIYAKSQDDLFFAQGFVAAQDRLWQLDLWRRRAEGRLSEILGEQFLERDRYARLLRYRGDWNAEWQSYSPDTRQILEAFTRGINAYIAKTKDRRPVEFQWLGSEPQPWTPETCVSRLATYPMAGNAGLELLRADLTARLGAARAAELLPTIPPRVFSPPGGLSVEGIDYRMIKGLDDAGSDSGVQPPEGSNNWVVAGARTATGKPILANDPHRGLRLPSLRYIVHLVAPGWNVIGAGEPALPGVSIGHNERIAFGLTIFSADQQDVYVERTNPADPNLYFDSSAAGGWRRMDVQRDEIRVRGEPQPRRVELKYTRHGPVICEDAARHRALVLRWVGDEPGTAGYLAGIAISRAQNWKEFRAGLARWKMPPENFVYADVEGNIGYQAAGLVPIRRNWDGLLPVPGDSGEFEWSGFYGLDDLPHSWNPPEQFLATANNDTLPPGEERVLGYDWDVPFRVNRIREVLGQPHWTVAALAGLQGDVVSLAAEQMLPFLRRIPAGTEARERAVEMLLNWKATLTTESPAAALYAVWVDRLRVKLILGRLPAELQEVMAENVAEPALISLLGSEKTSDAEFAAQNQALGAALDEAVEFLTRKFGQDWAAWRWGALHTATFRHTLGGSGLRASLLDRGPVERPGHAYTVNATSGPGLIQNSGATYRQVLDLSDWDRSLAINAPGQSGQPESPHYDDLLALWARNEHFPLVYSREAVEKQARERLRLVPAPARAEKKQ